MTTTTAPLELSPVIGGRQVATGETYEVRSPYDDSLVAVIHRAGPQQIEAAIAGAVRAFETTRKLPAWKRSEILSGIADRIDAAKEDFARTIALEAGKPVKGVRVVITGRGVRKQGTTNASGIARFVIVGRTPGILQIRVPSHATCTRQRVGVLGVFTPPVTG